MGDKYEERLGTELIGAAEYILDPVFIFWLDMG